MQRYLVIFLRMLYNSIYELHHSHIENHLMYANQADPNNNENKTQLSGASAGF